MFLLMLIKPQYNMGGEANMFRASIVPPQSGRIPVISGMMACSKHAEQFSN